MDGGQGLDCPRKPGHELVTTGATAVKNVSARQVEQAHQPPWVEHIGYHNHFDFLRGPERRRYRIRPLVLLGESK
jgi:hypothetical protein